MHLSKPLEQVESEHVVDIGITVTVFLVPVTSNPAVCQVDGADLEYVK